jgi:hypothetical protein
MKERPILFSAPMVNAILNGHKTQARRVIKPQPPSGTLTVEPWMVDDEWQMRDSGIPLFVSTEADGTNREYGCPYGKPGDFLWVRETWGTAMFANVHKEGITVRRVYRADFNDDYDGFGLCDGWKPSIHMPRNLSRILLQITEIRVEPVGDISAEDAVAEGCTREYTNYGSNEEIPGAPVRQFARLWDSINGKKIGCAFEQSPWVWAITFRRVKP